MKKNDYIKEQIITRYELEDTEELARALGITTSYLRVLAARLDVRKGTRSITNAIINGEKLCPKCNKILSVDYFNKDRYQPNHLDYWCRSCRNQNKHKLSKVIKNKDKLCDIIKNKSKVSEDTKNKDILYKKTRNPIVLVDNIESLKCKKCGLIKPLSEFHKDSANISGHKNFCKSCVSKRS